MLFMLHMDALTLLSGNICDTIKFTSYLVIPDGDFISHNIQGSFNQNSSFEPRPLFPFVWLSYILEGHLFILSVWAVNDAFWYYFKESSVSRIFSKSNKLAWYYIRVSFFLSNTTIYQKLAHISLCITEFLVVQCCYMFWLMEPSSDDTLTNLILFNYASSMDPYCTYCVSINWKIWCASLTFVNHLYMHRLSGCVFVLL
jgi:hypothetical protein